jgi:hypothetical protein
MAAGNLLMPRARQAQGRPATPVIPPDWQTAHGSVVTRSLRATVTIGPAGGAAAWSEGAGRTETAAAAAVYTGAAALMPVSDTARVLAVVDDPTSTRVYDVTLPLGGTGVDLVQADHVITVTASDDSMLTGKTLTVSAIERGSERFSRVLLAVLND